MPLAATQHTAAGAKAFAEFYIRTIDWGYATTSSAYMRHYFSKACDGCLNTANALDLARSKKRHFVGDRFTIRSAAIRGTASDVETIVLMTFDVTSVEVVDQANKYVDALPAYTDFQDLETLAWRGTRWTVVESTEQL